MVRVRIAPSPTGFMHIGTARTALFNWLFAKKNNGIFILRVEDTDRERSKKEYEENIIKGLEWLGLDYQEFYRQSERMEIYTSYIKRLLDSNHAFYCYHSKEELEKEKEEQTVKKQAPRHICDRTPSPSPCLSAGRLASPRDASSIIRFKNPGGKIKFNDAIRGEIEFDADLLGDFSIAKDETAPLYNFAAAIDDHEMKISHVIRGEDHISNTPKQILILRALGMEPPQYAHLPMILGTDRSKLSKRHGATALLEYRDQGYLPDAMFNFLALLGWAPKGDKEIMARDEIIKDFSLGEAQKSGAIFNIEKLNWMNGEYIRKMSIDTLTKLCLPYLSKDYELRVTDYELQKIIALEQPRIKKLSEIGDNTLFFFQDKLEYDKELLRWKDMSDEELKLVLEGLARALEGIEEKDWNKENLEKILMPPSDRGRVLWPLRVALSGRKASPGPFEILEVLGKEKALTRVKAALEKINT